MDGFDKAILAILQRDCRQSTQSIGEQVGLSASACQRRIKKLTELGVIRAQVALLDSSRLAGYTRVIIDVELERGGDKAFDDMREKLLCEPQVQQVYYTTGATDFTVIVVTKDMQAFDELSRRLFMNENNVKKFVSKVVIGSPKTSLALPL